MKLTKVKQIYSYLSKMTSTNNFIIKIKYHILIIVCTLKP